MKTVYEDEYIVVKETGRNYDFIATIENKTDENIRIVFEWDDWDLFELSIGADDWVGILADDMGYAQLEAIQNSKFSIKDGDEDN